MIAKPLRIEVVSDVVCPWCYIGKRRLELAIEASETSSAVDVRWRPYLLEPRVPREGMGREAFIRMHFSTLDGYAERSKALIDAAAAEGLVYRPDLITRQPNTIDCHRLIHWAGQEPTGDRAGNMEQRLMELFMREGGDLTDPDVLVQAAADCGMDAVATRARLRSGEDEDVVTGLSRAASAQGINAVPTYIFADRYVLAGARSTEWFAAAISELSTELEMAVND